MTRLEIKNKAKLITSENRRLFTKFLLLYFCIQLISELLVLLVYLMINNKFLLIAPPEILFSLPTTPYTHAAIRILSALLTSPVLLLLYRTVYCLHNKQKAEMNSHYLLLALSNKAFLKKSLALGLILCLFTVPFELLSNMVSQYAKIFACAVPWPWSKLLPPIFLFVSALLTFLLDFTYCAAALYPEKSAMWPAVTSVKIIFKNFFDYIVFVLSFLPWFLIELAGIILLASFAKNYIQTYTIDILSLVFVSPIMIGVGFYFWPYYNFAKAVFCKELINQ